MDGTFGPNEGLGVCVMAGDEAVDVLTSRGTLANESPFSDLADRIENQISIWFNHDPWVGV